MMMMVAGTRTERWCTHAARTLEGTEPWVTSLVIGDFDPHIYVTSLLYVCVKINALVLFIHVQYLHQE